MTQRLLLFLISVFWGSNILAQEKVDAPQLHSNLSVVYQKNPKLTFAGNLGYDFMMIDEITWNETSMNFSSHYSILPYLDLSLGIYANYVNQSVDLSSQELRGIVGVRAYTDVNRRYHLSNLTRIEGRSIDYSDNTENNSGRLRNLSHVFYSLNRGAINENRNLILGLNAEFFYNFDSKLRERFFNIFKAKLILVYRLNFNWRFDIGVLYQDTRLNIDEPVNLPTNFNTSYLFEWRLSYFFGNQNE